MTDKSGKPAKPVGELGPQERAQFKRRLSELDDRLDDALDRRPVTGNGNGRGKAMGYGLRMATDIIAAVLAGSVIGWYLDRWLGTQPVLLLIFIVLGLAAGMRNVIRTYRMMAAEYGTNTGVDVDDLSAPEPVDED